MPSASVTHQAPDIFYSTSPTIQFTYLYFPPEWVLLEDRAPLTHLRAPIILSDKPGLPWRPREASTAGATGLIPGWGTKIPYALQHGKKKKSGISRYS